jgi:hypothetical protein
MKSGATRSSWVAAGLAVLALQAGIANAADPAAAKPATAVAPAAEIDADALALLKKFGGFLAAQPRFGFELDLSYEVLQEDGQRLEFGSFRRYTVRRPDHLRIYEVRRSDGVREMYLDGKQLTVWIPADKAYALAKFSQHRDLDATLDLVRDALNIVVPLGDLLRSNPLARIEESMVSAYVVGREDLAGVPCDHVAWRSDEVDAEAWIAAGDQPLVQRVVLHYRQLDGQPRFSAQFRSWTLTPDVADSKFEFAPPEGAERVPLSVRGRDVQPKEESAP